MHLNGSPICQTVLLHLYEAFTEGVDENEDRYSDARDGHRVIRSECSSFLPTAFRKVHPLITLLVRSSNWQLVPRLSDSETQFWLYILTVFLTRSLPPYFRIHHMTQ